MTNSENRESATDDRFQLPWWLEGDQQCGFCLQHYSIDVEYRCIDCDHPVCGMCIVSVRESESVRCPQCDAAAGD